MSIFSEISRIKNIRDAIRTKLVALGLVTSTATLEACKTAIEGITNRGAVSKTLSTDMSTYTVPKGYHNGSGKVTANITNLVASNIKKGAVVGGVTGTYEGTSGTDTSSATATAADILSGMTAYVKGSKVTGSMTNNGAVSKSLTTNNASYTVPKGYHDGTGKVTTAITNLTASNIKKGVSVGGVTGTYAGATPIVVGGTTTASGAKISFSHTAQSTTGRTPKGFVVMKNGLAADNVTVEFAVYWANDTNVNEAYISSGKWVALSGGSVGSDTEAAYMTISSSYSFKGTYYVAVL